MTNGVYLTEYKILSYRLIYCVNDLRLFNLKSLVGIFGLLVSLLSSCHKEVDHTPVIYTDYTVLEDWGIIALKGVDDWDNNELRLIKVEYIRRNGDVRMTWTLRAFNDLIIFEGYMFKRFIYYAYRHQCEYIRIGDKILAIEDIISKHLEIDMID
ncbi:hypothetical protein [Sediminitomix flava]|uniref:Uncharacterized protein n=1 Tax=Sediminitomix flava TaxID=379075 RepID=A0A315ZDI7_SEDFL|nr:hypothetical protein [Sediminitomix flava]PWJ43189.1 hypothetical protein BC781_102738 [Sediminitomix flava]